MQEDDTSSPFKYISNVVEKHAEQRKAIQNFLAEISEKLETIQRLSEIHHASIPLHSRADAVIVAIFTVLERIVDEITRSRRSKLLINSPEVKLSEKAGKVSRKLRALRIRSKSSHKRTEGGSDVEDPNVDGADDGDDREHKFTVTNALSELQNRIFRF
ncbi:hypothetical protein AJ80_09094 [Polytolypa hystricis UAMH7299]|uniref:Uncharacterized protein n=1 Tax=Polytolypa hystricis (strain UAMH7299) TaxID=1447883 RepID=A0A2B7WWQ8_POLH7|nr:hypothetical protein AJ80_09094 [Polytolypa hystricis UAMH7299]